MLKEALVTLGVFMLLKALIIGIFTEPIIKTVKYLMKNKKSIRFAAFLEFVLGAILVALGLWVN